MAFIVLADVKTNLKIATADTSRDAELTSAITRALDLINTITNRSYVASDEIPEGVNQAGLILVTQFIENRLAPDISAAREILKPFIKMTDSEA